MKFIPFDNHLQEQSVMIKPLLTVEPSSTIEPLYTIEPSLIISSSLQNDKFKKTKNVLKSVNCLSLYTMST